MKKPLVLIIMDGYADNPRKDGNAVASAKTPTLDRLRETVPLTHLTTFGPAVGLPEGQMGNSEVGHLNIGAGRVVEQELLRINRAVKNDSIRDIEEFHTACAQLNKNPDSALHLIGLVSTGGVHSHLDHLKSLISSALVLSVKSVIVHVITDGRDRPPTASLEEVAELVRFIHEANESAPAGAKVSIGSLIGRYYAMDRDKRWERTELAYDLFTKGAGEEYSDVLSAINDRITKGETDEFYKPCVFKETNLARSSNIKDNDALLFFNFRADRMRQIVHSFLGEKVNFDGFEIASLALADILTLTEYEEGLPVSVLFKPAELKKHLGEVIAEANIKQVRVAETEKYPHVTYFFNGGDETPSAGENRSLIQSPKDVATYDQTPEMSALQVKDAVLAALEQGEAELIVVNFANCDMVGHTGDFDAAVKAVETVDSCVAEILEKLEEKNGLALITADHGNADQMVDYETGKPHTFHTMHPVPCFLIGAEESISLRDGGALCDIAPTILELLKLEKPPEMTGQSLLQQN